MPNYWRDPATGIGYQVQVEVPSALMQLGDGPRNWSRSVANGGRRCCSATSGDVKEGTMPGEIDRYNMRRLVSMTANIEGDDLGDVRRAGGAGHRGGRPAADRAFRSTSAAR